MSKWKSKAIKSLGRVVTGKTPPTDEAKYFDGQHLFVSPKDLDWDKLYVFKTETNISREALDKFKNQVIPKNAIMYTSLSFAFGKIGISSELLLTNQQISSIVVNSDNDFRFVYYLLRTNRPLIFSYNSGIDTPIVPKSVFEKIELGCPPLPIQKKIAAILSTYDDLIENNDRRITLLEKMAEEIYREWFVRLRFPGHEQVTFHKGIPEGWEVARIETLCKEVRNGVKIKNLDINTKYLGLEHLPRKSILINNFAKIDSVQSDKLLFKERDILFGKIRPYLHKVVLANFSGVCSSDTIIVRPKIIDYEGYLLQTLFSTTFIELATISSKGTKMPRADWDFLKKLAIIVPSQDLIKSYQEIFDSYFSLMCKISDSNSILKQTRDRLLTRLISGKLSIEDLDIQFPPSMTEPASENP